MRDPPHGVRQRHWDKSGALFPMAEDPSALALNDHLDSASSMPHHKSLLNVAYVGHSRRRVAGYVTSISDPGYERPDIGAGAASLLQQVPYFANILQYSNVGWSNYRALQTSLVERLSHGLTFAVSYTLQNGMTRKRRSDNFLSEGQY